jgi:phage baseplate assembly protein W
MKSFRIANGDLVIGTQGFDEVEGEDKVRQDLGIAVREPFGCDRFHPLWGSLLDTYVGGPFTKEVEALVQAEVMRLIANYAANQQIIMQGDMLASRRARFSSNEVIRKVTKIEVVQQIDTIHVRVQVETLTSAEVVLTTSVRL